MDRPEFGIAKSHDGNLVHHINLNLAGNDLEEIADNFELNAEMFAVEYEAESFMLGKLRNGEKHFFYHMLFNEGGKVRGFSENGESCETIETAARVGINKSDELIAALGMVENALGDAAGGTTNPDNRHAHHSPATPNLITFPKAQSTAAGI
jgi:hypothetical protein